MALWECKYAISSPAFLAEYFDGLFFKIDGRKEFEPINYDYMGHNLNELAMLAKTIPSAMDEFLKRVDATIFSCARSFIKYKRYLDFSEIYSSLQKTAVEGVRIFDPSKGEFIHLLRRMMKISLHFTTKNSALAYVREVKYFGQRMKEDSCQSFFCDSKSIIGPEDESVRMKLDLDDYRQFLTDKEKTILDLYLQSFTFAEIGFYTDIPVSTVSYEVYLMIDELRERFQRKMI
jgi:hypothetical protein